MKNFAQRWWCVMLLCICYMLYNTNKFSGPQVRFDSSESEVNEIRTWARFTHVCVYAGIMEMSACIPMSWAFVVCVQCSMGIVSDFWIFAKRNWSTCHHMNLFNVKRRNLAPKLTIFGPAHIVNDRWMKKGGGENETLDENGVANCSIGALLFLMATLQSFGNFNWYWNEAQRMRFLGDAMSWAVA